MCTAVVVVYSLCEVLLKLHHLLISYQIYEGNDNDVD